MFVEIQMRTIAMDFWASLEHKLRYKKNINPQTAEELAKELEACAEESAKLDEKMLRIFLQSMSRKRFRMHSFHL